MSSIIKHSYTVPCSVAFRDAVESLAARRKVNVGDVARSVLLVLPQEEVDGAPDPGEPPAGEREIVVLKSGPAAGRPWRRKPRLQVRMPPGYEIPFIRKALNIALAVDQGQLSIRVGEAGTPISTPPEPPVMDPPSPAPEPVNGHGHKALQDARDELERLRAIVGVLAFEPLPDGVRSREEALHVLGFPPGTAPDSKMVRAKFRMLATIHHPDSPHGSHQRMSQLNAAMELLRRSG
jgi:hypothetical protein